TCTDHDAFTPRRSSELAAVLERAQEVVQRAGPARAGPAGAGRDGAAHEGAGGAGAHLRGGGGVRAEGGERVPRRGRQPAPVHPVDRKSTRLNSSHVTIS